MRFILSRDGVLSVNPSKCPESKSKKIKVAGDEVY